MYLFKELTSDCVCVCGELVCRSEVLEPAWTLLSCPGRGEPLPEGRALPGAPSSPTTFLDLPQTVPEGRTEVGPCKLTAARIALRLRNTKGMKNVSKPKFLQ